jgi:hypothetical protein
MRRFLISAFLATAAIAATFSTAFADGWPH